MSGHWYARGGIFLYNCVSWSLPGNWSNWLSSFLDKRIPFSKDLRKRVMAQIILSLLCLAPFAFLVFALNHRDFMPSYATPQFMVMIAVLFLIIIVLVNFIYYFKYFLNAGSNRYYCAELQVESSSVGKEIHYAVPSPEKSGESAFYVQCLCRWTDWYKWIWSGFRFLSVSFKDVPVCTGTQENEVVTVQTEYGFIQNYISLLNIRFKDALFIHLHISQNGMEKVLWW